MPPRRSSQKSPSISKRRLTRSTAAAADQPPEASPEATAELDRTHTENETQDRDNEEEEDVEKALPEDGIPKEKEGKHDAIVADNASPCCRNITVDDIDRTCVTNESYLGNEFDADEGICVVNQRNLGEEVPVDDQNLENVVDKDSCLSIKCVVEDKHLVGDGAEGASEKENLDKGGVPHNQLNGEAIQDKKMTMSQGKNLSGDDVDGGNDSDAEIKHDSNVVEGGDPVDGEDDEDNECLSGGEDDDDSQLSHNPEHNLVEDESPVAKTEGGIVEEDGENCEDEEEEYDYEESENVGDDCELSEEVGDDYEESEDGEGKNEENKEDKSCDKSVDLSEKRRMKGLEIYIGGLNTEVVEDDLIKVFGKFGEIQSVRIIKQTSRRIKVFAFIQYSTIEQANNAVSELKDGVEVRGNCVKVSTSWENSILFMDNICKSWTKEHVLKTLKSYGIEHIEEVHLPNDPENEGQIKGFAILDFITHVDAVAAHQRLGKADAVFGCDRSAEVAFMRNQLPSIEDLSLIKASISRRRGGIPKGERGGSNVKKSSGKMLRQKIGARSKPLGVEKGREKTEQASSSKNKGGRSEKRGNGISDEKRNPTGPKVSGSKSHRTKSSITENRVVRVPSKSTTLRHGRKHLPLERDDRGKRKVGYGYDDRPTKFPRGNKQSTPRNAIRSPRRNSHIRERSSHTHIAISGSKRHRPDMEPHAGYVEPTALKQVRRRARYHAPDMGNHSERPLKYLEPAHGHQHQSHLSYLEPAFENRHQVRASYYEPSIENRHRSRLSYHEPTLENKHQSHASYLEPSLGREALPHGGYLEPAARVHSHYDHHQRLRRDDGGYNNQISGGSSYGRASALPSYASSPRFQSYSRHEADSSRRGGGYRHESYVPRR